MFNNYRKLTESGEIKLTKLPGNAVAVTYPVAPDRYDHRVVTQQQISQHQEMLLEQERETDALLADVHEILIK
jgi:hypothetical protein